MNKFYTIFTQVGAAKLANATALGTHVELTAMAVGDGNGKLPTPSEKQTALVHEVRRAPLNSIRIDDKNPSWIICEQVIPESIGGWTIREVGLFDKDNDLIAVGNFPETYKPVVSENSGRTQTIRVVLEVSSTEAMELKIDPSVVLATREYVDNQIKKATPKQLSATTKDVVDETGHTHALDMASEADAKAGKGDGIVSASQVASMFSQYGLWDYCQHYFHDLNNLLTNGQYQYNADKGSINGPEKYGLIEVLASHNYTGFSGWLYQTFYATSGNVYRRCLNYPTKWTEWRVLFDSSNFPIAERGGNALEVNQDYQDGSGFLYYHTPSKFPTDSYEIIQSIRGHYGFQLLSANANQNKLYWRGIYNSTWGKINTIWHSGNQGAGSGLDADKLDGQEGGFYQNASNINAGTIDAKYLPSDITSSTTGNASTATKLLSLRKISLVGPVTGSIQTDFKDNVIIQTHYEGLAGLKTQNAGGILHTHVCDLTDLADLSESSIQFILPASGNYGNNKRGLWFVDFTTRGIAASVQAVTLLDFETNPPVFWINHNIKTNRMELWLKSGQFWKTGKVQILHSSSSVWVNTTASLPTSANQTNVVMSHIWKDTHMGSGSGLDADKLDGQEGQHYLTYAEQQANSALASAKSYAVQQDNIVQKQAQKLADTAQDNAQKTASSALAGHISAKNPHSQYLLTDDLLSQLKQYFSGGTGYQYINGRLLQWGSCKGVGKHAFPIAFPNQCEVVLVTNTTRQGDRIDNAFGYPVDKTQFYAATKQSTQNGISGYPMAFLAIGN